MSADRPDRYPAWAADPALSTSDRAEPSGGEAVAGWPAGAKVPHENINWLFYSGGSWARYADHATLRAADLFGAASDVVRLSAVPAAPQVGGGLVQTLDVGGKYYVGGARLVLDPVLNGPLTYAAGSTNYVHARVRDATDRLPCAELLVSLNPSEPGYGTIFSATTDATTVTATAEATVYRDLPVLLGLSSEAHISIDQGVEFAGGPALYVEYRDSAAIAGVHIVGKVGATQGALEIDVPDAAAFGVRINPVAGAVAAQLLEVEQVGAGSGIGSVFSHSDGGGAFYAWAAQGAGGLDGRAGTFEARENAAGLVCWASSVSSQAAFRLLPAMFAPTNPTDGDFWSFTGGTNLYWRANSTTFQLWNSQDGPNASASRSTTTTTVAAATGPITLTSLNYFFRFGGTYRIKVSCNQGRTAGTTAIAQYTARIGATALSGLNLQAVDIPTGGSGVGTQLNSCFTDEVIYTHALADGSYTITFETTTTAGTSSNVYDNKTIVANMWRG